MHNNIEIKAVIQDIERTVSKVEELFHQNNTNQTKIEQHDTFFKAKDGRLKLRKFKVGVIINFLINTFSADKKSILVLGTYYFLRNDG